jgi:hypothetical protein
MNPYSRYLSQWSQDRALRDFVAEWDDLERLVIRVYKAGQATEADEAQFSRLRIELARQYPPLAQRLEPLWQQARVAGKAPAQDPFLRQVSADSANRFVGDWEAMQYLPAAREALNRALLAG